jgi:hypothetical protein
MFFKKLVLILRSMRGLDSELSQRDVVLIFTLIIIFMPSAHAFPLHGGNGLVNGTVYGVMKYEYGDGAYIDISASDTDVYNVELVDSDNKTYSGNGAPYRSTLHGFPTETTYNGAVRDMLLFKVPKDAIIKGLRIMPDHSGPFFINWTGVPEATGDNTTLKLYEATFEPNGMRWRQGNWNLEVNLTNNANHTAEYNDSDFAMLDQFGWIYQSEKDNVKKILPGESLRFKVVIPLVSEIARPVAILYKSIKLNISTWA